RTRIYQNMDGFDVGPVSRDGRFIALGKQLGSGNSDVYLFDRRSGKIRNLTAHEGKVSNRAADWSPDGSHLRLITDQGREFAALKSLELATGQLTSIAEPDWDVVGAGYSKSGHYLMLAVNQDARIVGPTLDAATLKPVTVAVPPAGLEISG